MAAVNAIRATHRGFKNYCYSDTMSERLPFSSSEELVSWAMGGANVCTWVWFWTYHVSISSHHRSVSQSKRERSFLLCRFLHPALHLTGHHGALDCVHSFKRLANQVGYIIVIAWVARDLWQRKQTLSSGCVLGLGSFTAIHPRPRAITIT